MLDTESHKLYDCVSAEELFRNQGIYMGKTCAVWGKVYDTGDRQVKLGGDTGTVICRCGAFDEKNKAAILGLKPGDMVQVYGAFADKVFQGTRVEIEEIRKTEDPVKQGGVMLDGSSYRKDNTLARTLKAGDPVRSLRFSIPESWAGVETELAGGSGRRYMLNEIPGDQDAVPEVLFVYYSTEDDLDDPNRIHESSKVMDALIRSVLKKDPADKIVKKLPIQSYYGKIYQYYDENYTDQLGKKYRVEFAFNRLEDDSLVYFVYLYDNGKARHVDDICYCMRTMGQTEGK